MSDDNYRPDAVGVEGIWELDKTISWDAHNEARQLNDLYLLPELYLLLGTKKEHFKRQHVYFIIGQIMRNTGSFDAAAFLIGRLETEKHSDTITNILSSLPEVFKPASLNIEPIYKKTEHRNSSVRGLAYLALTNTEHSVEPFLRDKLQHTQTRDDILWLLSALKYVGAKKALSVIEPHLKSRNLEIKERALETSSIIMLKEGYSLSEISDKLRLPIKGIMKFSIEHVRGLQHNLSQYMRAG